MGYYLELILSEDELTDIQTAVDNFEKAGAKVFPIDPEVSDEQVYLMYSEVPIFIIKGKSKDIREIFVRLSWAATSEEFNDQINALLKMAERTGYKIYDPQAQCFVTKDSITIVAQRFRNIANKIIGMVGKVEKKKIVPVNSLITDNYNESNLQDK